MISVAAEGILDQTMIEDAKASGIYDRLRPKLQGYARQRLGNVAEAEDVVQEAFLRFHKSQNGKPLGHPEGFLYRVTENLIIDRIRRRRFDGGPVSDDDENAVPNPSETITPEHHLLKKQELAEILDVINGLPKRRRQVFLLSRLEGMTYAEIADLLDISRRTVEHHMAHALLFLKDKLVLKDEG